MSFYATSLNADYPCIPLAVGLFCIINTPFPPQMRVFCVFALVAVMGLVAGEEGARLLASKSLLNRYAVEGRDLTLQYSIYNVGTRYCPLSLRS